MATWGVPTHLNRFFLLLKIKFNLGGLHEVFDESTWYAHSRHVFE